MALRSVVFDLDGTLIDSVPAITGVLNTLLVEHGRSPLDPDNVKNFIGFGARTTCEMALTASGGVDGVDLDDFFDRYMSLYVSNPAANTTIYPDAVATLEILRAQHATLGVCTNKPGRTTRAVLKALELNHFFSAAVGSDDCPYCKPDGRHLLHTLSLMDVAPEEAVYVGDSETDMHTAQAAGVRFVAVDWGYSHGRLAEMKADAFISGFAHLPRVLHDIARRSS